MDNEWQVQVGRNIVMKFLWLFIGRMEDAEEAMWHWGGVHGGGQEGRCFRGGEGARRR